MPSEHINNTKVSPVINFRHISYSVFYLLLLWIYLVMFVNHIRYFVIIALPHVYYCRRFLEVEDSIHKRILQNFTAGNETKPSQHTKKEEETGCY